MEKLKKRWGIKSDLQILIILIVFSINGTLAVFINKPILELLGISKGSTSLLLYWPVKIILLLLIYQITLVIIGTLFGQRVFFWNLTKKIFQNLSF